MERIYAPWRSEYFGSKEQGCVFCEIAQHCEDDEVNRVIYRDEHVFAVMNRYPYSPGHFMLLPHQHCDSPEKLPLEVWLHLHKLSFKAMDLLYEYGAMGINMGMNIKKAGGAGIPEHLHLHFVPRYIGDTNFMTSVADTRTYGIDFQSVYSKVKSLAQKHFTI
ncbi:HIT domain-containing protein [Helicobacter sp. MIT 05-5293]|uniref:HIT family protein n=1 Tax=Helicobacter sp. MIT 05-5293 TaxID=1548149 RepID=UPI00051D8A3F|nr:HIT domain-containing protein [Helicobacter sp. MIT 05-5293]TLD81901.1 HIT domain-containing protein [Helicobacter sp. MIT 05-5293]